MGLLIIVPLLVSGYMVCIRHPFFYVRLHRFQGQLLYLQVARMGMACLIVSTLLTAAVLAVSKQAVPIMGHVIATDYSSYLGTLLVQLGIASEKNGTPTESEGVDHAFTLIPILSGYRDKDTLEVTLNTHYSTAANPPPITLIQENVVSATQFDFTLWNAVHTRKTRKTRQGQFHQHRPARPMHAESLCA